MIDFDRILAIMVQAHTGQKDKDGIPEVFHPIVVGMAGSNDLEKAVGFLHDVIENSSITFADLRAAGIDERVLQALQLVTHAKDVPYYDYIQSIIASENEVAIAVKLHDLAHNLRRGRAGGYWKTVAKHEKAVDMFKEAFGTQLVDEIMGQIDK